jgi:hypothetical protein
MEGVPGSSPTATFEVSNAGDAGSLLDVSVNSLTTGYSVTSGLPIDDLATTDSAVTVTVQCDDAGTTPSSGTLELTTNAPGQETVSYNLSCDELLPQFNGDPSPSGPLNIAGLPGTSPQATFDVTNTGDAGTGLDVELVSISGGYALVDGLPINNLARTAPAQEVMVECAASTSPADGTLVIRANDGVGEAWQQYTYNLTCAEVEPQMNPPTFLDIQTSCDGLTVRYIAQGGPNAEYGYAFAVYREVPGGTDIQVANGVFPALADGEVYALELPIGRVYPEGTSFYVTVQASPAEVVTPAEACTP